MTSTQKAYETVCRRIEKIVERINARVLEFMFFDGQLAVVVENFGDDECFGDEPAATKFLIKLLEKNERHGGPLTVKFNSESKATKKRVVDILLDKAKRSNVVLNYWLLDVVKKGETLESLAVEHDLLEHA